MKDGCWWPHFTNKETAYVSCLQPFLLNVWFTFCLPTKHIQKNTVNIFKVQSNLKIALKKKGRKGEKIKRKRKERKKTNIVGSPQSKEMEEAESLAAVPALSSSLSPPP